MTLELQRLVDVFRDMRGGVGGGSSDGGVSRKNRSRPMQTSAGGAGGTPMFFTGPGSAFPGLPVKRGVIQGDVKPIGLQKTPASWYGQLDPNDSTLPGGWRDPGDIDKKTGKSLGNWSGSPQNRPGVSTPFSSLAGAPGAQQGGLIRVHHPETGDRFIVRQVDTGPNMQRSDSMNKGIDINAPLAEQMGYGSGSKAHRAAGAKTFPTGKPIEWEPVSSSQLLWEQRNRNSVDGAMTGWSRHGDSPSGSLNLDVNVRAPRGTKVDAGVTDGDFIPADRGISVNREMTEE
jgi:hypothetical protein